MTLDMDDDSRGLRCARREPLLEAALRRRCRSPPNWLDRQTGTRPVIFLGHSVTDPNPVHLLEFWNRSLTGVWSLDGTALSPGVTLTPNLERPDGTLTTPHTDYVLTAPGVDIVGRRLGATVGGYQLVRLPGQQLRLRTAQTGIAPDGWMGGLATYARYSVSAGNTAPFVSACRARAGAERTSEASSPCASALWR